MSKFALPAVTTKKFEAKEHMNHSIILALLSWIKEAFPSLTNGDVADYWQHPIGAPGAKGWLLDKVSKAPKYKWRVKHPLVILLNQVLEDMRDLKGTSFTNAKLEDVFPSFVGA